jgi:hypothetical protein
MKRLFVVLALAAAFTSSANAQSLFTYDFPGNPGSGLVTAQTDFINNVQAAPLFSDFTRVGPLTAAPGTMFQTTGFPSAVVPDLSQYLSFTVSGALGNNITLTQLVFDLGRDAVGPQGLIVSLFVNGGLVAFQPFSVAVGPVSSTWNFADVLLEGSNFGANAEFRFYGYASGGGVMTLGNVSTEGVIITGVPEPATIFGGTLASVLTVLWMARRLADRRKLVPVLA